MDNFDKKELPNATTVLVLGIVSLVSFWIYGLIGIITGIIALIISKPDIKAYTLDPEDYNYNSYNKLKMGRILAIIGLSLSALIFLVLIIGVFFFAAVFFV